MIPTQGPAIAGIGAIPDRTKSHRVPARKEMPTSVNGKGGKMHPTKGPSKMDIGAIPNKTKSHKVPGRAELPTSANGDSEMIAAPKSGEDRLSHDPVGSKPSKWHRRGYTLTGPVTHDFGKE